MASRRASRAWSPRSARCSRGCSTGTTEELRFDGGRAIAAVLERIAEEVPAATGAPADEGADERLDATTGADAAVAGGVPDALDPDRGVMAEPAPGGGAARVAAPGPRDGDDVARLFSAVRVSRRDDGGVVIEAPPETARALVSLFEGMSRLMAAAAPARS